VLPLRCVHRKRSTGFEDTKEMPLQPDDVIAGRYQVPEPLGPHGLAASASLLTVTRAKFAIMLGL
jgi:hypothetical protein